MTGINAQHSILVRIATLAAAVVVAAFVAATPAHAVTGEYNLAIPGGGNTVPPPLDSGTAPPASGVPVTPVAPSGTTTETTEGGGKEKKDKKKKAKKKERNLPELGPAKPPTIAAPVSAVARGTTPGLATLAGVLAALLITAIVARRLIRKQAA